jgi:vacuolar-type H+-ATPase subunit E/Vma4
MQTIRLKIDDKVYEKILWFLSKFSKEEVEVITEDQDFISTQEYLQKELKEIESGKAVFYSQEEMDNRLNEAISKYENNL